MPGFNPISEAEFIQSWAEADDDGSHPFACPLLKFNLQTYDKCKQYQFKRISDVKQHLTRRHALPSHSCSICWSPFDDEKSRTQHLRHANCQSRPQPEQLSPEEVEKIKSLRGSDPRSHWLAIWSQLFPGLQPPPSPYVKPNQIEEVKDLIYPGLLVAFRTNLQAIMRNNTDLASVVKSILDSGCDFYFHNLPKSRHLPPPPPPQPQSPFMLQDEVQVGVIQTATIDQLPRQHDGLGNDDEGLRFNSGGDQTPENVEASMVPDLGDFESWEGWM
ncbi:unnamed protein product [Clonostachys rosea]|uniref:C2H2-type domain-containing protein n=1 Tax=Bionectria ochroleuca TaxID=29856 RepID=A0ABY6U111_BIOOC|nr:unnamed protein product [Clonostachys rosea]